MRKRYCQNKIMNISVMITSLQTKRQIYVKLSHCNDCRALKRQFHKQIKQILKGTLQTFTKKAYGELQEWLHSFRTLGWFYYLAFLTLGTDPRIRIENIAGFVPKQGNKSLLLLLGIAPRLVNNPSNDLITTHYAYIITVKDNQIKA